MAKTQFNLLPDAKLVSVKSDRLRKTIVSVAVIASIISAGIFLILLATASVLQKKQLSDADKTIADKTSELQAIPGLDKIVTVQNQLSTLVGLHQNKHISSRIFIYLPEVTPSGVSVGRVSIDFKGNTMQIDGSANSQKSVNTFIDTLKFTTYTVHAQDTPKKAFPTVVESSFSINRDNSVTYALNIVFDPVLFTNNNLDAEGRAITPVLEVPNLTTTGTVSTDPASVLGSLNSGGGR